MKLKIILKIQNENEFHFWKRKSFFENENENHFLKTKILLGLLFVFPRASEKESFFFLFFNYIILYKPSSCQLKVFSRAKISPIVRIQHRVRATVMTTVVKTRPQYHSIFYTASSYESADFVENFVENFSTIVENFCRKLCWKLCRKLFNNCWKLCWKLVLTTVVFVENSSLPMSTPQGRNII